MGLAVNGNEAYPFVFSCLEISLFSIVAVGGVLLVSVRREGRRILSNFSGGLIVVGTNEG